LECAFGVVGKILMSRIFNGIYLVRFGFRMNVGDSSLKVISTTENSNKVQKTHWWR
jgi:hypothetical protein